MTSYRVALIPGSLRKDSFNRRLALAIGKLLPDGFDTVMVDIGVLPLYSEDDDSAPAPAVTHFKATIAEAQGVIFVTPEYNRSIPGVLKNAIDHGSRPAGKSVWAGKPAGIAGVSPGSLGTALAQQHLRNVLSHLDLPTLNAPELFLRYRDDLFDADGALARGSTRDLVSTWVQRYAAWVRKHAA